MRKYNMYICVILDMYVCDFRGKHQQRGGRGPGVPTMRDEFEFRRFLLYSTFDVCLYIRKRGRLFAGGASALIQILHLTAGSEQG